MKRHHLISIGIKAIIVAAVFVGCPNVQSDPQCILNEPLFGLGLDCQKIARYELNTIERQKIGINKHGADMSEELSRFWKFSQFEIGNFRYLMIAGRIPVFADTEPPSFLGYDSDFGHVICIDNIGGEIKYLGSVDVVFAESSVGHGIDLPESVAQGLVLEYIENLNNMYGKDFSDNFSEGKIALDGLSPTVIWALRRENIIDE